MDAEVTGRGGARGAILGFAVVALAAVWVLLGTRPEKSYGDTLYSRLATIYSLTEYGRWAIADSAIGLHNPFEANTVDKVALDERTISTKPPLLPMLMMGELALLSPVTGWLIEQPDGLALTTRILVVTWCGVPYVFMVLCVWLAARRCMPERDFAPAFLALAAAAGTQAASFAVVFNNHVIAAGAVAGCFYIALRIHEKPRWADFMLFGLCAGFCATMDMPSAIYPALLGIWLAPKHVKGLLLFALPPALALVALQSAALYAATGSPLPVQLHGDWYLSENSYWRNPGGVDALADPKGAYLFHVTLGRVGLFSLFPVTLLGIAGVLAAWRGSEVRLKALTMIGGIATAILVLYYTKSTNNYGGEAYGLRWTIAAAPALLIMAIPAVMKMRGTWQWAIASVLLAVSAYSVCEGAMHPWESDREWTTHVFGRKLPATTE